LLWWTKKIPVNTPLLTQATNPADPTSGALGSPNTAIVLGGQSYDPGTRYGGRFTLGGWLDSEANIGLEANYLFISPESTTQTVGSPGTPGSPVFAFPFFNVVTGAEGRGILATPNTDSLRLSNQLQGGELNVVGRLLRTPNLSLSGLFGFRYINLQENLGFAETFGSPANFTGSLQDSFRATNNFYGGQLGLRGEFRWGNFFVEGTGKVALGCVQQVVDVNGSSSEAFPGRGAGFVYTNAPGGFFAEPTNIGHHSQNAFCVVPEVDLKLGCNITRDIQAFVGYSFLYLSDVARPGTTIDHNVNLSQSPTFSGVPTTLVGPAAPTFSFSRSDFWAQGINLGLQFKF